mmetsp:Transcript_81015/g.229499  ORF Transcript_81015/g.229499 Transcript_81015/m.229499 type:complete len:168 (-) Transcript_81015:159-662(-)
MSSAAAEPSQARSRGAVAKAAASEEEVMMPAEFSPKLLRSSWLTLGAIAASLYFGQWDCCLGACLVLGASLNYWRRAVKGTRRNVDMLCAFGGLLYQLFLRSPELLDKQLHFVFAAYLAGLACGAASYLHARVNGARKRFGRASDSHRWLHFWGNASSVVLCYGLSL